MTNKYLNPGIKIFRITYFKKYSAFVFAVLFVAFAFIYQFDDILFMRPQSVH